MTVTTSRGTEHRETDSHTHEERRLRTRKDLEMQDSPLLKDERLVWSVEEAGHRLGISRAHAYELVARGELPHLRLGRRLVVPKRALEALLATVDAAS